MIFGLASSALPFSPLAGIEIEMFTPFHDGGVGGKEMETPGIITSPANIPVQNLFYPVLLLLDA